LIQKSVKKVNTWIHTKDMPMINAIIKMYLKPKYVLQVKHIPIVLFNKTYHPM
jgi:hypothetical protein